MRLYLGMHKWNFPLQKKSDIRKFLLERCSEVDQEQRKLAADIAAQHFFASDLFKLSQHVACYIALKSEFDCAPIVYDVLRTQKNCYLPKLLEDQKKIEFLNYHVGDKLQRNGHNILEPTEAPSFPTEELDLVVIPLVGFDNQGNRLGRGAGYYDRTFSFRSNNFVHKPFLLGLAYELQKVDNLPFEKWDVKLDGVLTEQGLVVF